MDSLEALIKAKIPCEETGIRICHTVCAICSPANNCGVNAYVKDGRMVKLEGMDEHPQSKGRMCVKGLSGRQFAYREDRILTPLKRVGERGEGKFEPITWEQAYDEIASRLNGIKAEYGADAVAFFGGYNKWYRPWLRRLAHSFGTMNFGIQYLYDSRMDGLENGVRTAGASGYGAYRSVFRLGYESVFFRICQGNCD